MKELLKEYFNAGKEEKISDKTLIFRVVVSAIVIVVCLIAMSVSAYAYFAFGFSSQSVIKSASYDLVVTPPEGVERAEVYVLKNDTSEYEEYTFEISTEGTYTTASVGYCKILIKTDVNDISRVDDVQTFYTEPVWNVENATDGNPYVRMVTIAVPAGKTVTLSFVAEWGSCALQPIIDETIEPEFGGE